MSNAYLDLYNFMLEKILFSYSKIQIIHSSFALSSGLLLLPLVWLCFCDFSGDYLSYLLLLLSLRGTTVCSRIEAFALCERCVPTISKKTRLLLFCYNKTNGIRSKIRFMNFRAKTKIRIGHPELWSYFYWHFMP